MVDTAIESSGLTKRYGRRAAVEDLDLAVPAGQVTGLIGANGAGKTTTIGMLLGLVRPSSGSAHVLGEPLNGALRYLARVGALVGAPAFYPRLSGRANLRLLERLSAADGDVEAALEATGMGERADDRVATYSLGMRQRLALAAALLGDPDLVILDEPANGLDPAGIVEMRRLLRVLADAGSTVLVSSHQLSELEQVCDHVVLLREGRLRYQGSLAELLHRRRMRIVAVPDHPADVGALAEVARAQGWSTTVQERAVLVSARETAAPSLNRLAHERGITLAELRREPPTLEDTFLALTRATGGQR